MIKQNETKTDPHIQRERAGGCKGEWGGWGWEYNLKKLKRHKKINTKRALRNADGLPHVKLCTLN